MSKTFELSRRRALQGLAAATAATAWPRLAFAADPLKIGLVLPLTGPFASTGRQIEAACRLYMQRNGDTVAGRKVELIVKDDTGLAPETTKRIAQEFVVQDKVSVLAGFGLTPLALASAPPAAATCEMSGGSTAARVRHYLARLADRSCVRSYGDGHTWYVAAEELGQLGEPALPGLVSKLSTMDAYELKLALYALMLASQAPTVQEKTGGEYVQLRFVLSDEDNANNKAIALAWWQRFGALFGR